MYKTIVHRYGQKEEFEFDTKQEAISFGEYGGDTGEHFFEYVVDDKGVIIFDGKPDVIGVKCDSQVGKVYKA